MDAKQLRNSILQMAIQGKLVPQDPNDEPASVLLDKIRQEKRQLVKEGKLKNKDLVEAPISDVEKPFNIPNGWEWIRWGALSETIQYGYNAPAKEKGRIKMVRISDIQNGKIVWETTPYCDINEKEIENYLLRKNDILFARTGGTVGKSYLVSDVPNEAIYAGYLIRTRYSSLLCAKYLKIFMESSLYWAQLKDSKIATAQPNCNGQKLSKMILPLPPLAEQRRIVAKLEEILPIVDEYGKAQEEADKLQAELPDKLRKSILQEAIQGKLVPQDPNDEPASILLDKIRQEKKRLAKEGVLKKKDLEETPISEVEKPFEIPDSWVWCRMQDVLQFINGRAYKKEELLNQGKYKVLRVGNFFTNDSWYYSDLELPDDKYCNKGDLLYAWSASFGPKIWEGEKTIFHYHIWNVRYATSLLYRDYLYYFFMADKNNIKSSTTGSTMVHVSMENMKPRLIPIPPLAEQHRIVTKIEELFNELKNNE